MEIVKKHHPDRAGADNAESKAIFEVRNFTKGFDNSLIHKLDKVQFCHPFSYYLLKTLLPVPLCTNWSKHVQIGLHLPKLVLTCPNWS